MEINAGRHLPNINRAALPQNFLRTDLTHTVDCIWVNMKTRQEAISRFWYAGQISSIVVFRHPTRINTPDKLNLSICHRRPKITSKNSPVNKTHLR